MTRLVFRNFWQTSNKTNEKPIKFLSLKYNNKQFWLYSSKKTKGNLEYLNAANLIRLDDIENKEKIKELEIVEAKVK